MQKDKVYIIWIWWIWVSAIARYYMAQSYAVYGSDISASNITESLEDEWANITIGENPDIIEKDFDLVIYSEAIDENQSELTKAHSLEIKTLSYPQALAEIANQKKLITIAGTHGKSTTTSLISIIMKNSDIDFTSVVGTLLKEFENKNFFYRRNTWEAEFFILEACEYKRSFLNYKPTLWIITNIELDHLDYYKNMDDYMSAFEDYLNNIVPGWFAIINCEDTNAKSLLWLRNDIHYIQVFEEYFIYNGQQIPYPIIDIKVPGRHVLFDAKIAYIVGHMLWINDAEILYALDNYTWVWRRMERIWTTVYNNILYSDYGHHPTEIRLTLEALKKDNVDKKILTIFQPHQYSRTLELLEEFKNCFEFTDELIIPNIYKSRDSEEDIKKIDSKKLADLIHHDNVIDGEWLNNSLKLIEEFDKNNTWAIILLLGAWDIDNLRNKIKTVY